MMFRSSRDWNNGEKKEGANMSMNNYCVLYCTVLQAQALVYDAWYSRRSALLTKRHVLRSSPYSYIKSKQISPCNIQYTNSMYVGGCATSTCDDDTVVQSAGARMVTVGTPAALGATRPSITCIR